MFQPGFLPKGREGRLPRMRTAGEPVEIYRQKNPARKPPRSRQMH